jgi:hypothetical protein
MLVYSFRAGAVGPLFFCQSDTNFMTTPLVDVGDADQNDDD